MALNFRSNGAVFLGFAILLLLATGLFQRVANPSLTYHLDAQPSAVPTATEHDHPPLTPEDAETLGKTMAQLRERPTDINLLLSIADIFNRNKDWRNAIGFLERAAAAAPQDMRPQYFMGVTLAGQGEHARAAVAFEKVLAIDPANVQARFNLAILHRYYLNEPNSAERMLREVVASPLADPSLREQAKKELERSAP